jgi:hypothetical protein
MAVRKSSFNRIPSLVSAPTMTYLIDLVAPAGFGFPKPGFCGCGMWITPERDPKGIVPSGENIEKQQGPRSSVG